MLSSGGGGGDDRMALSGGTQPQCSVDSRGDHVDTRRIRILRKQRRKSARSWEDELHRLTGRAARLSAENVSEDQSGSECGKVRSYRVRSWYNGDPVERVSTRASVARSWYGGYGALDEEEEDSDRKVEGKSGSLADVGGNRARKSGIDLLMPSFKSLVSMATLSRRRSSSTTALGSSECSATRGPMTSATSSVTALPLLQEPGKPIFRKCETVLALSNMVPPIRPINRLRVPPLLSPVGGSSSRMCSRCSSLLSMASSSRYSINTTGTPGFIAVDSRPPVLCKLCLAEVPPDNTWTLAHCSCTFCIECMRAYIDFEIAEGAYDISCPDALCEKQGIIGIEEIENLVTEDAVEKHKRFRLNREVDLDKSRTWCPRAGCETVCTVCCGVERCLPQSVHCPTCDSDFCSNCRAPWHAGAPCRPEDLAAPPVPGISFDSELIKCCPMCSVPIEKDEGCAQMMCKRCKHVFCWYCLASLDDDFLLRHYDKGPCKNKLGHSRASVIWHRTQVIGIFAGFGILLLVASPLLLLAAPCIVCCKCRVCSSGSKLDAEEDIPEESAT